MRDFVIDFLFYVVEIILSLLVIPSLVIALAIVLLIAVVTAVGGVLLSPIACIYLLKDWLKEL